MLLSLVWRVVDFPYLCYYSCCLVALLVIVIIAYLSVFPYFYTLRQLQMLNK